MRLVGRLFGSTRGVITLGFSAYAKWESIALTGEDVGSNPTAFTRFALLV